MMYDHPLTSKDFSHPFLIERKNPLIINNFKLSAKNIWECNNREELLLEILSYFKEKGFPYPSKPDVKKVVESLRKKDEKEIIEDDLIKNTSSLGLDVCRYYNPEFWNVRGVEGFSVREVFENEELLIKTLKNRMGWCTSTELQNGINCGEQPFVFAITPEMIIQGMHSSGLAFNTSNFKPLVGKYLLKNYGGKSTLDLAAGWGARYLAAYSLGIKYIGIDPLTANNLKNIVDDLGDKESSFIKSGSELEETYHNIETVDSIIVCPPYFNLEIYSKDAAQSTTDRTYQQWLSEYWKPTVENSIKKLNEKGKFILIILNKWQNYDLAKDMCKTLESVGLQFLEKKNYKTVKSHLTKKRGTKNNIKTTEEVYIYEL